MDLHANAKLGMAGRLELVLAIEAGLTLREAAVERRLLTGRVGRAARRGS